MSRAERRTGREGSWELRRETISKSKFPIETLRVIFGVGKKVMFGDTRNWIGDLRIVMNIWNNLLSGTGKKGTRGNGQYCITSWIWETILAVSVCLLVTSLALCTTGWEERRPAIGLIRCWSFAGPVLQKDTGQVIDDPGKKGIKVMDYGIYTE